MPMSTYLENAVMNHVFNKSSYTQPTIYLGIADDSATDVEMEAGTLTNEITSYTGDRPAVTFGTVSQVSGKATISNSADVSFVSMPAVTVDYAFLSDAATGGNILWWGALTASKTTVSGDTLKFLTGELDFDLE